MQLLAPLFGEYFEDSGDEYFYKTITFLSFNALIGYVVWRVFWR